MLELNQLVLNPALSNAARTDEHVALNNAATNAVERMALVATRSEALSTARLNVTRSPAFSTASETAQLSILNALASEQPAFPPRQRKKRTNRRMTLAVKPDLSTILGKQ